MGKYPRDVFPKMMFHPRADTPKTRGIFPKAEMF